MYYGAGNYEAFAHPVKPEGVDGKSAYIIGTGLAGLSAAFFLVRDGQMKGEHIHLLEKLDIAGGSCDGRSVPRQGYFMRGGREMDNHFEVMWEMFRDVPSIENPGLSVLDEYYRLNKKDPNYSLCRASVNCGEDALKVFDEENGNFDIALLDIMMPGIDGFQVCKSLRKKSSTIGIIMLSAKTQEMDKVSGLMLGADDYITKPFSPSELTARIDAVYRRVSMSFHQEPKAPVIESGPFVLNLKSRTVSKNGQNIDLTQVEYQILEYFMNNQNTALDRSSILTHIWGDNYFGDDKIVDVNIRRIRMKIEDEPSNPKYIATIWGFGYKWSADDASSDGANKSK